MLELCLNAVNDTIPVYTTNGSSRGFQTPSLKGIFAPFEFFKKEINEPFSRRDRGLNPSRDTLKDPKLV